MDPNTIIEALRGTMDPALREAAERQLNEAHKSLNFVSTLLQITMSEQLDLPVRQMLMRSSGKKILMNIYA
ncbi:importin 7, isoform CRA_b [Mus musculus]|uniref:Importin 7 n=1 Tax=Mus musculus TaxID=10090 RepID=A0A140LHD0_MOUSE|nr:importin 7, isoform CRA_b [Mus musculus]